MENKAIMRRFYGELFNKGNLSIIDEIFDKNFVDRSFYGKEAGIEDVIKSFKEFKKAFPDSKIEIEDMLEESDKVVTRFTWSGTHESDFMGMKPTGKKVKMSVIDIIRISDGKIIERWGAEDNLSLWRQLGKLKD